MSFSENLKKLRRQKGYTQEDLAQLLQVSRQAVGKWEQGLSYPEAESLLLLSQELDASLDELFSEELGREPRPRSHQSQSGSILITALDGVSLVRCVEVTASLQYRSRLIQPKFALIGVKGHTPFWGPQTALLGWYRDEAALKQEIACIRAAMLRGEPTYELRYRVKVRHSWGRILIDQP